MVSTAYTVNVLQHTLLSHIVTLFFCFYQFDLTECSSLHAPASSVDLSHHHGSACQPLNLSHCQHQNHLIWWQRVQSYLLFFAWCSQGTLWKMAPHKYRLGGVFHCCC